MGWVGVSHHAPHARPAPPSCTRSSPTGEWSTGPRRWPADSRARGVSRRRRRRPSCRTTAPSSWPRSTPPTTSAPSPCRSTGGSPRRSCASSSSTPRPGLFVCDGELLALADEATADLDGLARVCVSPDPRRGGSASPIVAAGPITPTACPQQGDDIHRLMYTSGTTGPTQGGHDHPRQPGVEELRPHRRVRLHVRRCRPGLRALVPRRRSRPRHHHDARGGGHHHHPPHVRRRRRRRRDRALPASPWCGPRRRWSGDPRRPGGRGPRPLVGQGDHRRWREDAGPVHRAPAAAPSRRPGSPTPTA